MHGILFREYSHSPPWRSRWAMPGCHSSSTPSNPERCQSAERRSLRRKRRRNAKLLPHRSGADERWQCCAVPSQGSPPRLPPAPRSCSGTQLTAPAQSYAPLRRRVHRARSSCALRRRAARSSAVLRARRRSSSILRAAAIRTTAAGRSDAGYDSDLYDAQSPYDDQTYQQDAYNDGYQQGYEQGDTGQPASAGASCL